MLQTSLVFDKELQDICKNIKYSSLASDDVFLDPARHNYNVATKNLCLALRTVLSEMEDQIKESGYIISIQEIEKAFRYQANLASGKWKEMFPGIPDKKRVSEFTIITYAAKEYMFDPDKAIGFFTFKGYAKTKTKEWVALSLNTINGDTELFKASITKGSRNTNCAIPYEQFSIYTDSPGDLSKDKNKRKFNEQIHGLPYIKFTDGSIIYNNEDFLKMLENNPEKYGAALERCEHEIKAFQVSKNVYITTLKERNYTTITLSEMFKYEPNRLKLYTEEKENSHNNIVTFSYYFCISKHSLYLITCMREPYHVTNVELLAGDLAYVRTHEILEVINAENAVDGDQKIFNKTKREDILDYLKTNFE